MKLKNEIIIYLEKYNKKSPLIYLYNILNGMTISSIIDEEEWSVEELHLFQQRHLKNLKQIKFLEKKFNISDVELEKYICKIIMDYK